MGDRIIKVTPDVTLSINAPFTKHSRTNMRVANCGKARVMWVIKSTNTKLMFNPSNGVLDPDRRADVKVLCEALDKPGGQDRIAVEFTALTDSGPKNFDLKYFTDCQEIQRKVIKIDYNRD
uniref:Major sperm protein n=1 Tax=Romanomermis culicivorax TaxID=13658 RepID=A0A915J0Y8_ROMCU